ncbi:LysR family transcriptional regulator [Schumannella soli]|uniref:LysR family transcriptional regulator n=2 Tax=Schumannella soli TaxID=2590779 RepID=A0A506XTR8_9MICO|nr:LysR family transcriptional regulator [Schumannella soli]
MHMDPEIDLHSLRIVRAIAEHGSISGAARALGYSQPAISQHLQRAESRIGMPLVQRVGRASQLTEAGEALARHAVQIGSAVEAAAGELAGLAGLEHGRVRLAAFPTASSTLVPGLLGALRAAHPGLAVSYVEAEPPEALSLLRDGLVDLAITFAYPGDRADPHRDENLEVVELFADPVAVVLPRSHAEADSEAVELTALADERWIAGCPLCRGHLLAACEAVGVDPDIGLETDNSTAVLHLVGEGLGVALLPRLALRTAAVPETVVVRPTAPTSDRAVRIVGRVGGRRVPAIGATLAIAERRWAGFAAVAPEAAVV